MLGAEIILKIGDEAHGRRARHLRLHSARRAACRQNTGDAARRNCSSKIRMRV